MRVKPLDFGLRSLMPKGAGLYELSLVSQQLRTPNYGLYFSSYIFYLVQRVHGL